MLLANRLSLSLLSCPLPFQASGLSKWLGDQMTSLHTVPPWAIAVILSLVIAIFTECTSNVATATLFLPVFASLVSLCFAVRHAIPNQSVLPPVRCRKLTIQARSVTVLSPSGSAADPPLSSGPGFGDASRMLAMIYELGPKRVALPVFLTCITKRFLTNLPKTRA